MPVPTASGVSVISIGMLKPRRDQVVAWRGPMLDRALVQMLADVYWGDLDVLLLDLPPGTGDVAISLGQHLPGAEVVVVTTPQEAAAEVAERAGTMASMMHQRVVGVVENMSYLPCPHCAADGRGPPARGVRLRWRRPGRGDAVEPVRVRRARARPGAPRPRRCARAATPASRSSTPTRPRPPPSCCARSPTRWPAAAAASPACSSGSPPPAGSRLARRVRSRPAGARRHHVRGGARLRPRQAPRPGPPGRPDAPQGTQFADAARDELREELGPEYADLELRDLDPRTIVRKHIIEAMNDAETTPPKRKGLRPLKEGEPRPPSHDLCRCAPDTPGCGDTARARRGVSLVARRRRAPVGRRARWPLVFTNQTIRPTKKNQPSSSTHSPVAALTGLTWPRRS